MIIIDNQISRDRKSVDLRVMIVWTITTPFYIRLQNHHYSLFTINNVFFGRKSEKRLQIILHRSINFTNFAHDDIQADTIE